MDWMKDFDVSDFVGGGVGYLDLGDLGETLLRAEIYDVVHVYRYGTVTSVERDEGHDESY